MKNLIIVAAIIAVLAFFDETGKAHCFDDDEKHMPRALLAILAAIVFGGIAALV